MKYRLNENPIGISAVPIIELIPGERGKIHHVGIYFGGSGDSSGIHFFKDESGYNRKISFVDIGPTNERHRTSLGSCKGAEVAEIANEHDLPLDELNEIRDLEREYRSRHAAPAGAMA
jgi:hypothetical protein